MNKLKDNRPDDHILAMAYELERNPKLELNWDRALEAAETCALVLQGRGMI